MINEDNYNYLVKLMEDTEINDPNIFRELKQKMETGEPIIQIKHLEYFGKDLSESILNLSRSTNQEYQHYFWNNYVSKVTNQPQNKRKSKEQIIYIDSKNRNNNLTPRQLNGLRSSGSVYRVLTGPTGSLYEIWQKFDFTKTETNGNFQRIGFGSNYVKADDLLNRYNILDRTKDEMWDKLNHGESFATKIEADGISKKYLISIEAQFKDLNIYDLASKQFLSKIERISLMLPEYKNLEMQKIADKQNKTENPISGNDLTKDATSKIETKKDKLNQTISNTHRRGLGI